MEEEEGWGGLAEWLADACEDSCEEEEERSTVTNGVGLRTRVVDAVEGQPDLSSFNTNFRMRRPLHMIGLAHEWPVIRQWDSLVSRVAERKCSVLIAHDNRRFFKHELCSEITLPFASAVRKILATEEARRQCENNDVGSDAAAGGGEGQSESVDERQHENASDGRGPGQEEKEGVKRSERRRRRRMYARAPLWPEIQSFVDLSGIRRLSGVAFKEEELCGVWISTAGNVTPLHYDYCHGFLVQVVGQKRFTMFRPCDTMYLYPNKQRSSANKTSSLADVGLWRDGDVDERARHPKLYEAEWFEVVLNPGDVLYTPPFFWHFVESIDDCVSVLVPFDPAPGEASSADPLQNPIG